MPQEVASTESQPERRGAVRSSVMLAAIIETSGASAPVRLVSLSATGFSVVGELPSRHCLVVLRRDDIALRARVAWRGNGRGGASFEQPADPAHLFRHIRVAQRRIYPRCARARLHPASPTQAERERLLRCAELLGIRLP